MLNAVQMQHGVPTVRALTQLPLVQVAEVQADPRMRADKRRWPHGNNRRQNLWRPEDGLFEIGLIGISCEKPTPNGAEILHLRRDRSVRYSDDLVENRDYGADIPTQTR